MNVQQLSKKLKSDKKLQNLILDSHISFDELSITVEADDLKGALIILRDGENYLFRILIDICGVDYPKKEKRFAVVYQLLSIEHNFRVKVFFYIIKSGTYKGIPTKLQAS